MNGPADIVVVGGSVGGLVASIYLRRAGHSVLLIEAQDSLGGACRAIPSLTGVRAAVHAATVFALDPRVVDELDLLKRGLTFAARDLPVVVLSTDGKTLALSRDSRVAAQAIATLSPADAERYMRYRRELFALARTLRPWWWEDGSGPLAPRRQRALLEELEVTSAAAHLGGRFESDLLKAALGFDAIRPFEPGSALVLAWRAAQEMCGLQGAVAIPQGGPAALADVLVALAKEAGVEMRTNARVTGLILDGNEVKAVEVETGERLLCRCVLSSLARRATLLDLAPTASAGFAETQRLARSAAHAGEAYITFVLDAAPDWGGIAPSVRTVLTDRLESWLNMETAAREQRLPDEMMLEVTAPTAMEPERAQSGQHVLTARIPGLPVAPEGGWPSLAPTLAERVVHALEHRVKNVRACISGLHMSLPGEGGWDDGFSASRILSPFLARIATPIEGLFLCGSAAEPMDAVSGRAGRLAAKVAQSWLAREKVP